MGLKDRIEEEMVVDTTSILDEQFDTAKQYFKIFRDGTTDITEEYKNDSWRNEVLIYLIGQRYGFEADKVERPSLPYEYFYSRIDAGDSTIRTYFNQLQDERIVRKNSDNDEWELVVESLPEALERIEGDGK